MRLNSQSVCVFDGKAKDLDLNYYIYLHRFNIGRLASRNSIKTGRIKDLVRTVMDSFNKIEDKSDYRLELYETSMSWWSHWITLFLALTLILEGLNKPLSDTSLGYFTSISGTMMMLFAILRLRSVFLHVTDKGIVLSNAILAPRKLFVAYKDIKTIYVKQTIIGRLFNYATLVIETNKKTHHIKCIEEPHITLKEIVSSAESSNHKFTIDKGVVTSTISFGV